ncbi:DNA-deoxyinosine glycosylase [Paraburkholderia sp. J67]|uniref:DNA-deoxyinosine glycosylase n=1 Tax=Paraburkholderia sp. J67 TaxID=2805435 RepID=UPI002ABD3E9E|nr:DNA-deoxyinosine glycosylase [Paraburkholderia sp. J67]
MSFKHCFPPVVDAHTRVLILGSLPGEASLAHQQYYAHKQNKFWHLVGEVIGVDLPALDYEARLQTLLDHRIGLWDVVAQARREGSLDGNIRDHAGNDLITLIERLPALQAIAFNGGTASRIGERILGVDAQRLEILRLPSSSPAYASMNFATKLVAWRALDAFSTTPDTPANAATSTRKRPAISPG